MKVVVLSKDTIINDKLYIKGSVVSVPDNFNLNIKRVVKDSQAINNAIINTKLQVDDVQQKQSLSQLSVNIKSK